MKILATRVYHLENGELKGLTCGIGWPETPSILTTRSKQTIFLILSKIFFKL